MATEKEWKSCFERLEEGETTFSKEAERLGCSKGNVYQRFENHLKSRVSQQKAELEKFTRKRAEEEARWKEEKKRADKWSKEARKNEEECRETEGRLRELTQLEGKVEEIAEEIEKYGNVREARLAEREKKSKLERENSELKEENSEIRTNFENQGLGWKEGLKIVRSVSDLQAEREKLQNEISGLDVRISRKKEDKQQLDDRIEALQDKKNELEETTDALKGMIQSGNRTLRKRRRQVRDINERIQELKEDLHTYQSMVEDIEGKREERSEELKSLERKIAGKEECLEELNRTFESRLKEMSNISNMGAEIVGSCDDIVARIESLRDKYETLYYTEAERLASEIGKQVEERVLPDITERKEKLRIQVQALGAKVRELSRQQRSVELDVQRSKKGRKRLNEEIREKKRRLRASGRESSVERGRRGRPSYGGITAGAYVSKALFREIPQFRAV